MNTKTKKKYNKITKKTLRYKPKKKLTEIDTVDVYKKTYNGYNSFEDIFEKTEEFKNIKNVINTEGHIIKMLHNVFTPNKILPNHDFYTYINYLWLKKIKKEKNEGYLTQIDDFRLVQNKVYYQLVDIVKDFIKNNKSKQAQQISNVYNASIKLLNNDELYSHINNHIKTLDTFINNDDINSPWKFLGLMNRNECISYALPFVFSLQPDGKDSSKFRCYILPPQLSLIDINVYFDDGTDVVYKQKYRKEYLNYIKKLFNSIFGKNHKYNPQDVYDIEYDMLMNMGCTNIKEKSDNYYNKINSNDSYKYNFNLTEFLKAYGFKKNPDFFISSTLNYLKCGSDWLINNWKSEKLRTYFIFIFIRQIVRFHHKFRWISFEFRGKFMRGQEFFYPKEIYPVLQLSYCFNTFLTNEYIKKYKNEQNIQYVKNMATDLVKVFTRIIERNQWLQPKTKEYALLKLKHFKLEVGSPKILRIDPDIEYSSTDMWYNFNKINDWRSDQFVKLEGENIIDIPLVDWSTYPFKFIGNQAYVVNASYTPSKNGIYIPLGYIQKPFVDLDERGIEYNLAYIGYTLAHEMSHALDDMGSQYDYKGNLYNWWTPEDKKIFKQKQKDVISQYEEFAKRDGVIFDASPTVGEDLADISGIAICEEYLRDFQMYNEDIFPIKIISYKAFIIYFAHQYRQKVNLIAYNAQLKTNPHPLSKYRTNVPLSRLKLFRDIYNVKKGDGMYWHNTDSIWK